MEEKVSYVEKSPDMKAMSNFDKVCEFHYKFNMDGNRGFTQENIHLRTKLIEEEYEEFFYELWPDDDNIDKKKVAKELADLLYVVYGAADLFDIPIDQVFNRVHESNMSKLDKNGNPIYREDGKVLKGENYKEANLNGLGL